jgi:hypothetical protein
LIPSPILLLKTLCTDLSYRLGKSRTSEAAGWRAFAQESHNVHIFLDQGTVCHLAGKNGRFDGKTVAWLHNAVSASAQP